MTNPYPLLPLLLLVACTGSPDQIQPKAQPVTITLDFTNPNNTQTETGYQYTYNQTNYPADQRAYQNWNCTQGPTFFAAYNDVDQNIWLATCTPIDTGTIQLAIGEYQYPPANIVQVADAHEVTYHLQPPANIQEAVTNGTTIINLYLTTL